MPKLNLIQKLIEVRKAVPYLQKDKEGFKFKYVSSSQTLGALRGAMDEQGVLLIPRVVKASVLDHTTAKGGHEFFTCLDMEFTWANADDLTETLTCPWYGQGLDSGEKGVGKAMTYAEKTFLLKSFNIATDKDDPDAFQGNGDTAGRKAEREEGAQGFSGEGRQEQRKPTGDGPSEKGMAQLMEIHELLTAHCLADKGLYKEKLEELTTFEGRDGGMVKGIWSLTPAKKWKDYRIKRLLDDVVKLCNAR